MRWLQGTTIAAVLALGALVVLEGVVIRNLQRRVAALEAEPPMLGAAAAGGGVRATGRTEVGADADEAARTARREAFDAALRERIAAVLSEAEQKREDERSARVQEALDAQLEAWADAERVDPDTLGRVQDELRRRGELFRSLRQEIRDGTLTFADARDEIDASREESDAALRGLLGPERFASLQADVLARMGPSGADGRPPPN